MSILEQAKAALIQKGLDLQIEVCDIVFKAGARASLTIYIDKEEGVDHNVCEAFHKQADIILDEFDITNNRPYTLNVSSLGLDRPFKTPRDFERNIGQEVEVKLFSPYLGKKYYEGVLQAFTDGSVSIATADGQVLKIEKNKIAKISKLIKL